MIFTLKQFKKLKKKRISLVKTKWLFASPQKKCECVKVLKMSPKKPNSAKRSVGVFKVSKKKKEIRLYIPGIGHSITMYTTGLFRGGKTQDLPSIRYKVIRGALNVSGVSGRTKARSKYGVKRK